MPDLRKFFIEPLDQSKHRWKEFDCGVDALNDYLKKRARKKMDAGLAVCFVAIPESDPECIAGFYTLSAATILTTALPEMETRKLPRYENFRRHCWADWPAQRHSKAKDWGID